MQSLHRLLRLLVTGLLASTPLLSTSPAAESWESIQLYSQIKPPTPELLANEEIKAQKINLDGLPDCLSVESIYLLPLRPEQILTRLRKMLETPEETDVPFSNPANPDDFHTFQTSNTSQWAFWGGGLVDPRRQNLSDAEKKNLADAARSSDSSSISSTWQKILLNRARCYQKGGLMAAEPYQFEKENFQPGPELVELLKKREPVLSHFMPLLDGIMSGREIPGALPVNYYRQDTKIEGKQAVALSAFYALPGDHTTAAEITFYVSSQYNLSLILYELFPVTVQGKIQTYVWRGDYVITPALGFAKGIEQMAAQNIMLLEIKKSIRDFCDECRKPGD